MGDPKKIRKKYRGPMHPWEGTRIEEERIIKREYGLKTKKEIWKVVSELRRISAQAKKLIGERNKNKSQTKIEEKQLLDRLIKYGFVSETDSLEAVLSLKPENLLERRLETQVFKNKMALTVKQARQFIVHGHIFVNGNKVTVPSYLVKLDDQINFSSSSGLVNAEHPERTKERKGDIKKKQIVEEVVEPIEITEKELERIEKEAGIEVEV